MTVRELINALITYDVDEEIQFFDNKENILKVIEMGTDLSLPYIMFKKMGDTKND